MYQVDGAEKSDFDSIALRKCLSDCVVNHIPSVSSYDTITENAMSQCSLQSPCVKCMQVGIFIIFYRRVHIKIASSHNYLSQILCRIAPTEQLEALRLPQVL